MTPYDNHNPYDSMTTAEREQANRLYRLEQRINAEYERGFKAGASTGDAYRRGWEDAMKEATQVLLRLARDVPQFPAS